MSQGEMLELGTVTEASMTAAMHRLEPVAGIVDWKSFESRELKRDGKPEYVLFFFVDTHGFLFVAGSAFVGDGKPDPWLWCIGADMIAKEFRARGLKCETKRRGHVEQCLRVGWKISGVALEKNFETGN
jgi:hypothetical protein